VRYILFEAISPQVLYPFSILLRLVDEKNTVVTGKPLRLLDFQLFKYLRRLDAETGTAIGSQASRFLTLDRLIGQMSKLDVFGPQDRTPSKAQQRIQLEQRHETITATQMQSRWLKAQTL
jgi:hypothetical protein